MNTITRTLARRHVFLAFGALLIAALACGGNTDIQTEPPPTRTGALGQQETEEPAPTPEPATDEGISVVEPEVTRADLIAATVQIMGVVSEGGELYVLYNGSGTILHDDGIILTNAHVANPGSVGYPQQFWPDSLVVAVNVAEDQPPEPMYVAEIAAIEPALDLAVIRIVSTLDGTPIQGGLGLPTVPIGDSDTLHVGDSLDIFGFPSIGGSTITFTTGNVSGFTAEEGVGNRAFIKTDAAISGGNSGGLAASTVGQIVGVPTQLGSGQEGVDFTDCRVLQDTNGDGIVDQNDTCIPTGGFINAIRPINLAKPLVQAAMAGVPYEPIYGAPFEIPEEVPANISLTEILWSSGADANGEPVDVVENGFPSGVSEIHAFYGYEGMQDGIPVTNVWYIDGELVAQGTDPWDAGASGIFDAFLFTDSGALPDGVYDVEIYIGEQLGTTGQTTIGGGAPAETPPTAGDGIVVFGTVVDSTTGRPIPGATVGWLVPGLSVSDFTGSEEEIWDAASTDNDGFFVMNFLLNYGQTYSLIVVADGYQPLTKDHLEVTRDLPTELELTIELQP